MSARASFRVDLTYGLFHPGGGRAPGEQKKTWFFEIPVEAPSALPPIAYWTELLHRIFYDANVAMRRREPNDVNWLGLVQFWVSPVLGESLLAWDGRSADLLPWVAAERAVVWESGACYFVANDGRYDTFGYIEYTELIMNRLLDAGRIDAVAFQHFMRLFFPNNAATAHEAFADRAQRVRNIEAIREGIGFRRQPGSQPMCSGPPQL